MNRKVGNAEASGRSGQELVSGEPWDGTQKQPPKNEEVFEMFMSLRRRGVAES